MATVNEELLDALVRHQIFLMRLSGSIRNQLNDILNKTEADIADRIRSRLLNHKGLTPDGVRRLKALEKYIQTVRLKSWQQINAVWAQEMVDLAKSEPEFLAGIVRTTAPVVLQLNLPSPEMLEAIVKSKPFEGRTLKEWSSSVQRADIQRINDQIKIGMVQGQSSAAIARRVVGTARLKGANGVTEITRRHAASITRTAVNHVSNFAKREFYKANSDIIDEELYVATLDARTTRICSAQDGKRYPVGEGPIPPLHFNCRSLRVPVVDGLVLGNRPAKPVTEKGLLREYARKEGFNVPTSRERLPYGHKTKFGEFKAKRIRELTGRVPAKVSYQEWLNRQSAAFQDDVLGPTKGRLFRRGNLKLDRFVNRAGDELPLKELARKHAEAFRAAGLDPEEFL